MQLYICLSICQPVELNLSTGCSLNIAFSLKMFFFRTLPDLLVTDQPSSGWAKKHWHEGFGRIYTLLGPESRIYFQIYEKYLMNTLLLYTYFYELIHFYVSIYLSINLSIKLFHSILVYIIVYFLFSISISLYPSFFFISLYNYLYSLSNYLSINRTCLSLCQNSTVINSNFCIDCCKNKKREGTALDAEP